MQYNRVISFGDSFTYGSELADCFSGNHVEQVIDDPENYPHEFRILQERQIGPYSSEDLDNKIVIPTAAFSLHTWPALLAKHLNADYKCQAYPGTGNQTIVRKILHFINDFNSSDLLIINWTYISRWDFYDSSVSRPRKRWKTIRPDTDDTDPIAKFYLKHIQSELWDKWETLRNMLTVACLLENKNIPFIMTSQDPLIVDQTYHLDNYINNAQLEIKDKLIWFDGKGFNDWAEGYPRGNEGHPLEEAHQKAFEYIRDNYDFTK